MITFGIDPGSHRTGWGAILAEGSSFRLVDVGVIEAGGDAPLPIRLESIFVGLSSALERCRPDRVFLESVFHHKSAKSALVLGHARGVALLAAGRSLRPLGEIAPAEVKKAVTGNGRAEKGQVQEMVRVILGLDHVAAPDASDALAIAIAGASRARFDDVFRRAVSDTGWGCAPSAELRGRDKRNRR